MPVPTSSRYEQLFSPPSMISTPSRFSHSRNPSNNTGYSPTVTSVSNQPKLNVVSRLAIEGKAKRGQEGASIRMFLKVCTTCPREPRIIFQHSIQLGILTGGFYYSRLDHPTLPR